MKNRMIAACICLCLLGVAQSAFAITFLKPGPTILKGSLELGTNGAVVLVLAKGSKSQQVITIAATKDTDALLEMIGSEIELKGNLIGSMSTVLVLIPSSKQFATSLVNPEEEITQLVLDWWYTATADVANSFKKPIINIKSFNETSATVSLVRIDAVTDTFLGKLLLSVNLVDKTVSIITPPLAQPLAY